MDKEEIKNILGSNKSKVDWMFYIFMLVIAGGPLAQGLFWQRHMLIVQMIIALLFIILVFRNKKGISDQELYRNPFLIACLLISLGFFVGTFVAVNQRVAIGEALKHLNYVIVFLSTIMLVRNTESIRQALRIVFGFGVMVSLIGLVAGYGAMDIFGAFQEETGRVMSTLQYPNTLGIFSSVVFILGIYLASASSSSTWFGIIAFGNVVNLLAVIGTQSRAVWLVLPFFVLLLIIGLGKGLRSGLASTLISATGIAVFLKPLLNFGQNPAAIGFLIGSLVVCLVLARLMFQSKLLERPLETRSIIVFSGAGLLVLSMATYFLIPENVMNRLASINLEQHSVVERGYFFKDALKIIAEQPVLGYGGGGWASMYQKYQSYHYLSNEVHNHYLQAWLEGGLLAFLGYIFLWVSIIYIIYKVRASEQKHEASAIKWTIIIMLLALGAHSFMDFNMSYGAIANLFWALVAILGVLVFNKPVSERSYYLKNAILALALVVIFLSGSLRLGIEYAAKAAKAQSNNDMEVAISMFERSKTYDPFNGDVYYNLGVIGYQFVVEQHRVEYADLAKENALLAVEKKSSNSLARVLLANVYLLDLEIDMAVQETERALELAPWDIEKYELLANTYYAVGVYLMQEGEIPQAKEYLAKAISIPRMIEEQKAKLTTETERLWVRVKMLEVSEGVDGIVREAKSIYDTL